MIAVPVERAGRVKPRRYAPRAVRSVDGIPVPHFAVQHARIAVPPPQAVFFEVALSGRADQPGAESNGQRPEQADQQSAIAERLRRTARPATFTRLVVLSPYLSCEGSDHSGGSSGLSVCNAQSERWFRRPIPVGDCAGAHHLTQGRPASPAGPGRQAKSWAKSLVAHGSPIGAGRDRIAAAPSDAPPRTGGGAGWLQASP